MSLTPQQVVELMAQQGVSITLDQAKQMIASGAAASLQSSATTPINNAVTKQVAASIDASNSGQPVDGANNGFLNGQFGVSASSGGKNDPLVYMGKNATKPRDNVQFEDNGVRHGGGSPTMVGGQPNIMPQSKALLEIYGNDNLRKQWATALVQAGYLSPTDQGDITKVASAWNTFVGEAAKFTAAGNPKSPFDVLKLYNLKYAAGQVVSKTMTDSQTQNYSGSDVEARLKGTPMTNEGILQKMLGRNPTPHEVTAYQAGLNAASAKNPQVSKINETQDAAGNTTRSTVTSGGVDANQVLANMAEQDPEYGAYQAATTYMDALRKMAGGYL